MLPGSTKEYIALYTITAKNKTSQWLSGVKISHGPLPQNSTFDPLRSSPGCVSMGGSVECTVNLGPNESKPMSVAYQVKSSISCLLARALQSAKVVVNGVTGTATGSQQVTITVSCSMQKGGALPRSTGQAAQGSVPGAQGTAGGTAGGMNGVGWADGRQGTNEYPVIGNKSTGRERLPRTGIVTDYFSPVGGKSDFTLISQPTAPQDAGLGVIPLASFGLVITLVVVLLTRGLYRLGKA
ncbi:MAG: hypothetical protein WC840_04930 [Candidatus Peribacteraceae bacterium]